MTERTRVGDVRPGSQFRLLADWQIDGTDERVPTVDVLTAFDVEPNGTIIRIRTEVGTLSLDNDAYVDVVADAD